MDINTMHIGIDLGLQAINSNVFGRLQHEEKDYFLNVTTQELVKAVLTKESNTVFNLISYADIRKYYEILQVYIQNVQLNREEQLGEGYIYGDLPTSNANTEITSGKLIAGVTYKVGTAGTTDLSKFGYKETPVAGETFICKPDNSKGTTLTIMSGDKVRILNTAGNDFVTTGGAPDNNPGTVFIADRSVLVGSDIDTEVEYLTHEPAWDGTTSLIPVTNMGFYLNLDSKSLVTKGQVITTGNLTVGERYIVDTPGTTDFTAVGGYATNDTNTIFTCTASGTITWAGGTRLYLIDDVVNRLVKPQDVENFKQHSFGSVKTSPISIIARNKLMVHHDNKFTIYRLFLDYINTPATVNWTTSINSDLPESMHGYLVDLTVKRISAMAGTPQYPSIRQEVIDESGNMQMPKTQQ